MSTLVTVTYHLPGRQKTFVSDSEIGTLLKFKKEYGEAEHQVIKVSIQRVEKMVKQKLPLLHQLQS